MSTRSDKWMEDSCDCRPRPVQRTGCGEHLCSFHDGEVEHARLATAFVASALGTGDRVLYVADEHRPEAVVRLLTEGGVDADRHVLSTQLVILDIAAVCGPPADAGPDAAIRRYRDEAQRARAAGYPGLRITVEMRDVVETIGSLETLIHWEHSIGHALSEDGITAVCQYDQRALDPEARKRIVAQHAAVATDDGTAPRATITASRTAGGLRIAGDLDLSTAPSLARALRARALVSSRVHVDLVAVAFADVAGLRTFFEVARELPPDARLVLRTPAHLRRLLALIGWQDPRVEVMPA